MTLAGLQTLRREEAAMWTFKTSGEGAQAHGFDATFDGPVEEANAAVAIGRDKADELTPAAAKICQDGFDHVLALIKGTANGKRRLSVNLSGGAGPKLAWSFILQVNLAEDPEA